MITIFFEQISERRKRGGLALAAPAFVVSERFTPEGLPLETPLSQIGAFRYRFVT